LYFIRSDEQNGATMSDTAFVPAPDYTYGRLVDHYHRAEQPRHRDAKTLLAYWRACIAKGSGFVVGRDIPARPIANILSNIVLCEPLSNGMDMRVRLAGSMVRHRVLPVSKGSLLSEDFSGEDFKHHLALCFEAMRSGVPVILDSSLKRGVIEEIHSEVLLLPVTAADLTSTWLLAGMFYFNS
jgi:hypothetical protein